MKLRLKLILAVLLILILIALIECARILPPKHNNIILFVPDGFSFSVWSTVRYVSVGEKGITNLDRMPNIAHYSTYTHDSWITDSAAGITAIMTGSKTNLGIINQDTTARYEESAGADMQSLMEYAGSRGMATGIITTSAIYDATPASAYAHHFNRKNYSEITAQLLSNKFIPDIIMAGGRKYIRPKSWIDAEAGLPCERTDDRDLINELKAREYKYFETADDFYKWDPESEKKVIALFNYEDMCYEIERNKDIKGEPGLWDMVDKGLKYLKSAPNGFFLLIEAGRIDHCAHDNFQDGLLYECIAFDKALGVALEFLESNPNTLILVATDHGAGGPNGIGFINSKGEIKSKGSPGTYPDGDSDGFPDSLNIANPVVIGWASNPANLRRTPSPEKSPGEHTAEDGIAFAAGKNSQLLSGFMDNTDLYYIIKSTMEGRSDVPVLRKRAGK